MIEVEVPAGRAPEREYILRVLLQDFLGLPFRIRVCERHDVVIRLPNGASLAIPDVLLGTSDADWLSPSSLPLAPSEALDIDCLGGVALNASVAVPVLYPSGGGPVLHQDSTELRLGFDLIGACFFFLTRYEEYVIKERDSVGRFPFHLSYAARVGLIERAVVNEYVDLLWKLMSRLTPGLPRCRREFRLRPSHDADFPFALRGAGPRRLLRSVAGEGWRKRSITAAVRRLRDWWAVRRGDTTRDPYNTYGWLMSESERRGLVSTFYFMAGASDRRYDPGFPILDPALRGIMREIADRGHMIGLHPSFQSYRDTKMVERELLALKSACGSVGVVQREWGSRQHFLRWEASQTPAVLADAGIRSDSSIGFAERAGFRAGVCYEYEWFDIRQRRAIGLREQPLVVMDATILERSYMNCGSRAAAGAVIERLKAVCRRHNGDFVLLWHNSRLDAAEARELYREAISG